MGWTISPAVGEILSKSEDLGGISASEAVMLLRLDPHSKEVYALMETASRLSRTAFGGKGERHFHIGLNIEPCRYDCLFCSLTRKAGVFTEKTEFPQERVLSWAAEAQATGADALNLMTTGAYSFDRLLEIGRLLREAVATPLVANTRDISHKEGEKLLEAGFVGCYHAVRLGEGKDTPFNPEVRRRTIGVFRDVGLLWMNCVEPVGPEHSAEEIAGLMVLARELGAVYSGVMRRINFHGSPKQPCGMIGEWELARMVAVSRLVMGGAVRAHCTHEPNLASLAAGANLVFPEVGSSPRDREADTGQGRGYGNEACATMLREAGLNPGLPSNCFAAHGPAARAPG
jgi:biotin synthase